LNSDSIENMYTSNIIGLFQNIGTVNDQVPPCASTKDYWREMKLYDIQLLFKGEESIIDGKIELR